MKHLFAISVLALCLVLAAGGCNSLEHNAHGAAPADPTQSETTERATGAKASPSSLVRAIYHGDVAVWPEDAADRSPLLSEHLSAAVAVSQQTFGQFFLTFDPIVNGQDALIEGLVVHPALIDGDRAYVNVRFRNFDQHNALVYSFVRENGSWKLDEIASIGGEVRWMLTDVLRNP